jgi:glucose-6-phosphate dehydrogenase assembly protein OpcA
VISLWDTDGNAVVNALGAERRSAGGVASGLALSLVVVVDEKRIRDAEAAATIAAAAHPCRIIIVARYDVKSEQSRLDAEIVVGGRLGPCEAVVMRMRGRLALHAESVVMPLLAPDVPVVTWWHMSPPERIAHDPLGVVADRRITDALQSSDPLEALRTRADDYAPGDTDLAWTRATPWRTLIAGAFDALQRRVTGVTVIGPQIDPTAVLLGGWLQARLGVVPEWESVGRLSGVRVVLSDGDEVVLEGQRDGTALLKRTNLPDRILPLGERVLGDELAEELRRLDPDQPYAAALGAATGRSNLDLKPAVRVHVWHDPALAEKPEAVYAA